MDIVSLYHAFDARGIFTLGTNGAFNPATEPLTVHLGSSVVRIPAFQQARGAFVYFGVQNGEYIQGVIYPLGDGSYWYAVGAAGVVGLPGPGTNPLTIILTARNNTSGPTTVTVNYFTPHRGH